MVIDLYHIIDIDFGGGDADSAVVLIAWHLGIDKSCVLALLLYRPSYFIFFFFFFFLGGDDEWIIMITM